MQITRLYSGSSGNCTLIETENIKILLDVGVSMKKISEKVDLETIDVICITHNHIDHIKSLNTILKKYTKIKLVIDKSLYNHLKNKDDIIEIEDLYFDRVTKLEDLKITKLEASHDTPTINYVFENDTHKVAFIHDTGYFIEFNKLDLKGLTDLYIESNYDKVMLMFNTKRPEFVKNRTLGNKGHLSNEQAYDIYKQLQDISKNTINVELIHISSENNNEEKLKKTWGNLYGN